MKANLLLSIPSLQLFAEGGAAGGAGAGVSGAAAGSQAGVANTGAGAAPAAVPDAGVQQAENPGKAFQALIRGQYKAEFDAAVKNIVRSRMKGVNETVEKWNAAAPVFEMLAQRYGIRDPGDIQGIQAALDADDSFFEQEALRRDMTVEQYREVQRIERQNAQLTRQLSEQRQREQADRQYAAWLQQEAQAQQIYPDFSLETELENDQFRALLLSGIGVKTAYEVIHKDEILPRAMQFAAQSAAQKAAAAVAAGAARPAENGMASQGAATTKMDVSKMTKAQREDMIRRAARGERITF